MEMKKIVIATHNRHKLIEMKEILKDLSYEFLGLEHFPDIHDIEETGDTLIENSLIKARTVHKITGYPAIGDDTGLEVDFLNGAPGVKSARFAGEDAKPNENVELLLQKLKDVPDNERTARFRTVISFVTANNEKWVEGIAEGKITEKPVGNSGFGYDPIFYFSPLTRTFAELSMDEKNKISHRGLALEKFRILLGNFNLEE